MECRKEEGIFKVQSIRVSIEVCLGLNTLFVYSGGQTFIIAKAEHINIKTDRPRYAFFPDPKLLVWHVNHDFYRWTGLGSVIKLKPNKDDAAGSAALLGTFCEVLIVLMGEGRQSLDALTGAADSMYVIPYKKSTASKSLTFFPLSNFVLMELLSSTFIRFLFK
jgi:hypothetical protein